MARSFVAAAMVGLLMLGTAQAQDYPFQNFAADNAMNTLHMNMLNATIQGAGKGTARADDGEVVSTRYESTAAVSAKAQEQFIDFLRETAGEEGALAIKDEFERMSPVEIWSQIVEEDGLKPGDIADALAGYWILNWVIANQAHEQEFDTQPMIDQVRAVMVNNPDMRELDDAAKQEMAEVWMMNFIIQQAVYSDAVVRGDSEMMSALADAAVKRFSDEMGVDLRELEPTDEGFVKG